jgi:hypothetical protein
MIVQLGQNLGLAVIAEGVENEMQARTLMSYGCNLAQGYFYAKPLTRSDLHDWLESRPSTACRLILREYYGRRLQFSRHFSFCSPFLTDYRISGRVCTV